jgi:hypothetical protein
MSALPSMGNSGLLARGELGEPEAAIQRRRQRALGYVAAPPGLPEEAVGLIGAWVGVAGE